jgi:uncharacterized protein (TIGR02757 family)
MGEAPGPVAGAGAHSRASRRAGGLPTSESETASLRALLDPLVGAGVSAGDLANDPIRFVRRYGEVPDQEVAGAVAACLAFGRVSLFGPVLADVFAVADAHGGPARFADALAAGLAGRPLAGRYYRWLKEPELVGLFTTFGRARARHGSLAALFPAGGQALATGIDRLRGFLPDGASRALRATFPHPRDGSACKRWCMYLRWMVRTGAPDLGAWRHLDPADLVIPLDTHVFRVAGFLGLRTRRAPDWKAAEEITAGLRRLCPEDPLRYDFALAHLGISGRCRGRRDQDVCPSCPLVRGCRA